MANIEEYSLHSGRVIKEDGSIINEANIIEQIGNDVSSIKDNEKTVAIVIPLNGQSTDEIDVRGYRLAVIEMPSAWDAAPLAFTATTVAAGTHTPVFESGIEVYEPAAASQTITIASNALALDGLKFIKIWSGKLGARVNQTAARTLNLTLKR